MKLKSGAHEALSLLFQWDGVPLALRIIYCCVVEQIMLSAFMGEIPKFLTRTKCSSPDIFFVLPCANCNDDVMTKLSSTVA